MVEGMEKIIATVSGYDGLERLKLIQLITAAGANYASKMSNNITHLICWKFKGKKYDLAMKLGTTIVSHRWFEDCIKEGKYIPEHSYTEISGQGAGFIRSDLSVIMEQPWPLKENKSFENKRIVNGYFKEVIDLDSDEIKNDDFNVRTLSDENLVPKHRTITTGRERSKRKLIKEASKENRPAMVHSIRSNSKANIRKDDIFQSETSAYLPNCSNKQRSAGASIGRDVGESSRRSRRLVKKKAKTDTTMLADSTKLKSRIVANSNAEPVVSNLCNDSNELREEVEANISSRKVSSSSAHGDIGPPVDTGARSDYIPDADERNLHAISSNHQNLEGNNEDKDQSANFAGIHKSVELSCVICWTNFSSTRGILPCGHRFCFSCIQDWADHMASNRKESTCPLCKTSFASITRVDGGASLDQKIYSQTVPCASSSHEIFIVPEAQPIHSNAQVSVPSACCHCQSTHPVDLLIYCQTCQNSCIHSYCLDPPLFPWTCISCRDRRLFYQY